ncbi:uncharacterized protein PHACADRAFT_151998 [Phanerochaete carnosa HHB-10118-sp]|uniref:Protein kinase domain-containing protein n=1 Tax=Phanerochaete carnosa (strain HHB-10118-sp) TaxID=650164 RepID=K5VXL6_PHACS|nr:uncharacterized protein PHACADRAFT_151998 [Phanerochaete carnosa HHB-10118-sp]EKM51324.1 hypothetical protein PHACADRAFT_151998 [Phanerochaete carnosa HHB-10118-sp]
MAGKGKGRAADSVVTAGNLPLTSPAAPSSATLPTKPVAIAAGAALHGTDSTLNTIPSLLPPRPNFPALRPAPAESSSRPHTPDSKTAAAVSAAVPDETTLLDSPEDHPSSSLSALHPNSFTTPRVLKVSGTHNTPRRKGWWTEELVSEMDSAFVMLEQEQWFAVSLPGDDLSAQQLEDAGNFQDIPVTSPKESTTYPGYCSTFNKVNQIAGGKYCTYATGLHPELKDVETGMKTDLCTYKVGGPGKQAFELGASTLKKSTANKDLHQSLARTAWAYIVTPFEIKTSLESAPFRLDVHHLEPSQTQEGRKARAQMTKYAAEIQLRQHRRFVFTVFICERIAWLFRWDRTGAIVSRPFDIFEKPELLLNFVYRVARASPATLGYDTSVEIMRSDDPLLDAFNAYRERQASDSWPRAFADDIWVNKTFYPLCKVQFLFLIMHVFSESLILDQVVCDDVDGLDEGKKAQVSPRTYTYIIGRHRSGSRSPTGRGGKGFIAYDVDRARLVFIKDYWCADHPEVHPELEVYRKLNAARLANGSPISHIATAIAGGDVDGPKGQVTLTQEYLAATDRTKGKPARRFHHRFVVWQVGRPLETYDNGLQLVSTVYQALLAHRNVYEIAGILHRDISIGNILIDIEVPGAILNDWDLCKYRNEMNRTATQHARSGTWAFMSGPLLEYPLKPNELPDDLESFIYVLELSVLRFHDHSLTTHPFPPDTPHRVTGAPLRNSALARFVGVKFDAADETDDGYVVGGAQKILHMQLGVPGFTMTEESSPLWALLQGLYKLGREHYATVDVDDWRKKWGATRRRRIIDKEKYKPKANNAWLMQDMDSVANGRPPVPVSLPSELNTRPTPEMTY